MCLPPGEVPHNRARPKRRGRRGRTHDMGYDVTDREKKGTGDGKKGRKGDASVASNIMKKRLDLMSTVMMMMMSKATSSSLLPLLPD